MTHAASAGEQPWRASKQNGSPSCCWTNRSLISTTPGVTVTQDTASYPDLAVGASAPNNPSNFKFTVDSSVPCGTQRPGMNSSLAVAPDGTIYTATRGHLLSRETWLVAINANLTQKWISTLRDRMPDGCGVPVSAGGSLPPNGARGYGLSAVNMLQRRVSGEKAINGGPA